MMKYFPHAAFIRLKLQHFVEHLRSAKSRSKSDRSCIAINNKNKKNINEIFLQQQNQRNVAKPTLRSYYPELHL